MSRHITAVQTTSKETGVKRYYHDGKRVSRETFDIAEIRADRISCLHSTANKRVSRNHSLLTIK